MSNPTREPTTWGARFKKALEEKLLWVLLLIFAAVAVSTTGYWFLGYLALASVIAVPTIKWFFGKDRSKLSLKLWTARALLAAFTLAFFIYGWVTDGFTDGALYAGLIFLITGFGWVKREKMLAGLILLSFVVLSEFGTVVCFTAALLVTAGMLHKQGKIDSANKKNLFQDADLS